MILWILLMVLILAAIVLSIWVVIDSWPRREKDPKAAYIAAATQWLAHDRKMAECKDDTGSNAEENLVYILDDRISEMDEELVLHGGRSPRYHEANSLALYEALVVYSVYCFSTHTTPRVIATLLDTVRNKLGVVISRADAASPTKCPLEKA